MRCLPFLAFVLCLTLLGFWVGEQSWAYYIIGAIIYMVYRSLTRNRPGPANSSENKSLGRLLNHTDGASVCTPEHIPERPVPTPTVTIIQEPDPPALAPIENTGSEEPTPTITEASTIFTQDASVSRTHQPRFRTATIIVGAMIAGAIVLIFLLRSLSHPEVESVITRDRASTEKWMWDPATCESSELPMLQDRERMKILSESKAGQLRIVGAHLFCAYQLDPVFFSKAAVLLERNHLTIPDLIEAANGFRVPLYQPFSEQVANFLKVFDVGPLLLLDDNSSGLPQDALHSASSRDSLHAVKSQIDVDAECTVSSPKPQSYTVRTDSPKIVLVTDAGTDITLSELITIGINQVFKEQVRGFNAALANWGVTTYQYNIHAALISAVLQINLVLATQQRSGSHLNYGTLNDLRIFFVHKASNIPGFSLPAGRVARYDRKVSEISGIYDSLPKINAERETIIFILTKTLPASLLHEFFHYLFFRDEAAESGFILEGEATALGEYTFQQFFAGATASGNDPLRKFSQRLFRNPAAASPDDWAKYNRMAEQRIRSFPFTATQCQLLEVLRDSKRQITPSFLENLLKLTPSMFQDQDDVELAYATAWGVYHLNNAQHMD